MNCAMGTIQGHCRENCQSWEGALAYLLCNRTTSHVYLLYTYNWEFIVYRISSVPLGELKQFHTCVGELRSYKLICMFFYTATTTNELCHSGVHNCPHNCLRPLMYYTTEWLTVATIIPLWTSWIWGSQNVCLPHTGIKFLSDLQFVQRLFDNKLSITCMLQGYQWLFFCHIAIILPI